VIGEELVVFSPIFVDEFIIAFMRMHVARFHLPAFHLEML